MKKNISKGEKWLRECLGIAVVAGVCVSSVAEAGETVDISAETSLSVTANSPGTINHSILPTGVTTASDYTLNLLSGSKVYEAYGVIVKDLVYTNNHVANNNTLNINNATVFNGDISSAFSTVPVGIVGAYVEGMGEAKNNTLRIDSASGFSNTAYSVYGSLLYGDGIVTGNKIIVDNTNIASNAIGAMVTVAGKGDSTASGQANENIVTVTGSSIGTDYGNVTGGWVYNTPLYTLSDPVTGTVMVPETQVAVSNATLNADGNSVTVVNNSNVGTVYGGNVSLGNFANEAAIKHYKGTANKNTIKIDNHVSVTGYVIGGNVQSTYGDTDASYNKIKIGNDVTFIPNSYGNKGTVRAGQAMSMLNSDIAVSSFNSVEALGGDMYSLEGGYAYTAGGTATSNNNSITATNVNADYIRGGNVANYAMNGNIASLSAKGNSLVLDGNNNVISAEGANAYTSYASNVEVSDNIVTVNDGQYKSIIGGYTYDASDAVGGDSNIEMKNNTVLINGGTIDVGVAGSIMVFAHDNTNSTYKALDNTVIWTGGDINGIIGGEVRFKKNITPGNIGWDSSTKSYTNILWDSKSTSNSTFHFYASATHSNKNIWGIGHFKHYNFYIDNTVSAGSTLINVNNIIGGKVVPIDLRGSTIGVALSSNSSLEKGDSITLLATKELLTDNNLTNNTDYMLNSNSRAYGENIYDVYDFTLANDGCNLNATVGSRSSNPKSEDVPASRQPEVALIDDKLDIVDTAYNMSVGKSEPVVYFDFNYSDVKKGDLTLRGSDNVIGSATTKGDKEKKNTITQGPFIEYGDGSFGGKNFYSTGGVEGSGKNKKYGAGYLFRQVKFGKHHFDAYVRAGKINNEFRSFMQGVGNVDYDNSDVYYAAHFGYGQYMPIDPHTTMDVYGKYFYKIIPGSSTTTHVNGGTDINTEFDALTSHKFRIGSKITWDYMEEKKKMMFADLALEHELSHTQTSKLGDRTISNSSGADTTAVMEIGYRQVFGPKDAFLFTADLQGYAGTRTGFGGNIGVRFNF